MRRLLIVSAAVEGAVGVALILIPTLSIYTLLGKAPETPMAICVTRGVGVSLIALGTVYWLARNYVRSAAVRGLVVAILIYNGVFILILGYARLGLGLDGIGLWPGILLHIVLAVWCVICLGLRTDSEGPAKTQSNNTEN